MLEHAHIFTSRNKQLIAIEHSPELNNKKFPHTKGVIIVIGGSQTRVGSHRLFVLLSRALAKQGLHVFRFDYTGTGDSEGDVTHFTDIQTDISNAINFFKQQQPQLTQLSLWGLCDAASAILLYLAQSPHENNAIHRLILVNPWVSQPHTTAKTHLKSYYFKRLFKVAFWKKLLTGNIDTNNSLHAIHHYHQQSKQAPEKNTFVDHMLLGLKKFTGKSTILLSGNDLTADEFTLLIQDNVDWHKRIAEDNISIEKIDLANHTFSTPSDKQLLFEKTYKTLLLE